MVGSRHLLNKKKLDWTKSKQKSSKQAQTKSGAVAAPVSAAIQQQQQQAEETKSNEEKSLNSLSLDLFDHLKISDVDSEGYSLRPDSSIDLRRRTNDNMNNYVSSPSSSESDSDEQPFKVMLKINPKKEEETKTQNMDVLREISKNLQLQKPPSKTSKHSKTYHYNYNSESSMTRSVSMGSNLQADLSKTESSLFEIDFSPKTKKCFGCMKVSFPYAILKLLPLELPLLEFNLKNLNILNQDLKLNTQLLEKNENLFTDMDEFNFRFRTQNLVNKLKSQHQMNKMAAFFNFELLKYEFRYLKEEAPLVLEANWSSNYDEQTVQLNLDYRFTYAKSLAQCNFMVLMPMVVRNETKEFRVVLENSEPSALVNRQEKEARSQVLFQIGSVSVNGKVSAKFRVSELGGEKLASLEQLYQPVYAKFHIDNDTLSKVKFKITSANYKLSLLKEKVESGKYFCDYDPQQSAPVPKSRS